MSNRHLIGTSPHPKYPEVRIDLYYVSGDPIDSFVAEAIERNPDGTSTVRPIGVRFHDRTISGAHSQAVDVYNLGRFMREAEPAA